MTSLSILYAVLSKRHLAYRCDLVACLKLSNHLVIQQMQQRLQW